MRTLVAASLFAVACAVTVNAKPAVQDPKQPEKKKAQPKVDPKAFKPDEATLKQIVEKTEQLRKAVAAFKEKKIADDVLVEVEIYLKAAENIVRFEEWLHANSVKWALQTLDQGLDRAKQAEGGKAVWRDAPGKWVNRAYRSQIDDSIQPYAVLLPHDYGKDPKKKWRLDVVLHGRDGALTEAKFIATHGTTAKEAPKELDYIQLEVYGRGNNAYRWAGERDVFDARYDFQRLAKDVVNENRVVLRGFSMGGAGTWHIGLHHPSHFSVLGPGAGFTTTHGYIANLPKQLPEYQEKCLRIYDAVDYAENAFNVPIVAYSGEKDSQKKAADNIENALRSFKEPFKFTHLVAPGLEHQMPKEWQDKAEVEYRKYADKGREPNPERVRFVTYTPRYGWCGGIPEDGISIHAMETTYEKAIMDVTRQGQGYNIKTSNVRGLLISWGREKKAPPAVTVDDQKVDTAGLEPSSIMILEKVNSKWAAIKTADWVARLRGKPEKGAHLQGPIDDAFLNWFAVVKPTAQGWHQTTDNYAAAAVNQFGAVWDRYFRGSMRVITPDQYNPDAAGSLVLFGDPQSNPLIAKVLPKLPIIWTKDKLVVNGVEYDPKTHIPVLVYPNPLADNGWYVVINSGHTFKEADLKGTNALLYPRLGDWAVIKPTPTERDPAAYEVVAAGLFDENWQFTGPVADGAKLEKLWGEGEFTEGPAEGPDGCVYFSDIGNRIMKFDPKTGNTAEYRNPGGRTNGLKFDATGRLIACEGANTGGGRRISVTETDGAVKTLADRYDGKRFNSPNDLTLDSKGRIYFSDPRYVGDEKRELDHESIYRVDPDGTVTLAIKDVVKPNGLVISPDGKTLYVSDHSGDAKGRRLLVAYPLNADGTVGPRKELFDFGKERGIDGMTVTKDGVIVATAGSKDVGGIYFFSPEGKQLAFLKTPEDPNNCCFAGPDKKTLYITAGKSLYRVRLTVAGK